MHDQDDMCGSRVFSIASNVEIAPVYQMPWQLPPGNSCTIKHYKEMYLDLAHDRRIVQTCIKRPPIPNTPRTPRTGHLGCGQYKMGD